MQMKPWDSFLGCFAWIANWFWFAGLYHRWCPLDTYLIAYRKVLAVLRTPADSAVQAFVHIAVPLVRSVPAVVFAIAKVPLRNAASVGTHEEGAIAQASWKEQDMGVKAERPAIPPWRRGMTWTWYPGRLIPLSKSLRDAAPFLFAAYIRTSFLGDWCCWWHWRESSWEPNSSLTCSQTFKVQRQFVRVVGTVRVAIALPLRAEKTAPVPTAKFLWPTGTIDWRKRKTAALLLQVAATSFQIRAHL